MIFCIGFNKTATVSLYSALNRLGFIGIHGLWNNHLKVLRAITENKPLLAYLQGIEHITDLDIIKDNFKLLDTQYPNSKFILNTREKESWLNSRKNHYQDYVIDNKYAYSKGWRWIEETPDEWSNEWDLHHKEVNEYFKDRKDDLLIMDIPSGDGWEKLCTFLDKPILSDNFPRQNVTPAR